jgi:hypothetical protein
MKVIIAGARWETSMKKVDDAVKASGFEISEVVCGEARGVDRLGSQWASLNGIIVTSFPANWSGLGKYAGPARNEAMAKYADALIAIPHKRSIGTFDMIAKARKHGLPVYVVPIDQEQE